MVVAELAIGCDAGVVGSRASAVISGETRLAGAFAALADAALWTAAKLTLVSVAAEVLAFAKWTADYFVLLQRGGEIMISIVCFFCRLT